MPSVSRKTDLGAGHDRCAGTPAISGSPDVELNGLPALRLGDRLEPHSCSKHKPHERTVAEGSSTVFVNGRSLVRIGDAIDCGGEMAQGSPNVFADDNY
ncbi:PAAR domain-containing protein [Paracoccus fistulariae]|uniref:PAAR domain-containing protein n=1 Tax=Paracoccus fistulariae TaxID=658446 RepID=A0ABY7SHS9_9RHOB|nr:PAAR domain-containing protein [Paracoccus fistulariae]MDB6183278.1 PAAR domain-containing protein [Paracoccus fistulariae]WCR06554.1 PAAR domain-containing protein [Paracoccus fistulariae]